MNKEVVDTLTHIHRYMYIHTHTTEYCSAIEKNEIMPFAASWMELEIITLNEGSQTEKDKYDIIHTWNLKK